MFNIIEEFYYGNIDPSVQAVDERSEYANLRKIYNENSEKLLESLDGEKKQLLLRILNSHNESNIYECKEKFMLGFRLGARFVLDTFVMPRYNELNCEYEEI